MKCHELEKDLALEAIGALDAAESARVLQHVQTCHTCAARLREYQSVCAAQVTAAAELHQVRLRTSRSLAPQERYYPSVLRRLARWLIPVAGFSAAALVFLLLPSKPPRPAANTAASSVSAVEGAPAKRTFAVATLGRYRQAMDEEGAASLDSVLDRDADLLLKSPSPRESELLVKELY